MNNAITIDNRQFERRQERQGKKGIVFVPSYPKANYSCKRQYPSTSYRYYTSYIDIDAIQREAYLYKDKSDITCFNYSKKGHFKREYYSTRKDRQRPILGKEVATIEKGSRVVEVSVYNTYDQDDLKADIKYKDYYVREESDSDRNGSNNYNNLERRIRNYTSTEEEAGIIKAVLGQNAIRIYKAYTYTEQIVNQAVTRIEERVNRVAQIAGGPKPTIEPAEDPFDNYLTIEEEVVLLESDIVLPYITGTANSQGFGIIQDEYSRQITYRSPNEKEGPNPVFLQR